MEEGLPGLILVQPLLLEHQLYKSVENRNGLKIACIEEIAFRMGYIDKNNLKQIVKPLLKTSYGKYLQKQFL